MFFLFAVVVSCTSQRVTTSSNLVMRKIESENFVYNNQEVTVDFVEVFNQNYKFEVLIRNKSKDSIFVTPASFKYSIVSESAGTDSAFTNVIIPEDRIEQLSIQQDSLRNKKNPYSLLGKSSKEIVTDGIIAGTIGRIFGHSGDDLELQRQKDEDNWEREHSFQLNSVDRELNFWNNDALLPLMIPAMSEVSGKVLIPVSLNANIIKIEIPIKNDIHNFTFKQLKR